MRAEGPALHLRISRYSRCTLGAAAGLDRLALPDDGGGIGVGRIRIRATCGDDQLRWSWEGLTAGGSHGALMGGGGDNAEVGARSVVRVKRLPRNARMGSKQVKV